MACPTQHASLFGNKGKHMPWPDKFARLAVRMHHFANGKRAFLGGDAGLGILVIDRRHELRAKRSVVLVRQRGEIEALTHLGKHRYTDQPPTSHDKIDRLGCRLLGRTNEVPFVLAIFGIDDDDNIATCDRVDGILDCRIFVRHNGSRGKEGRENPIIRGKSVGCQRPKGRFGRGFSADTEKSAHSGSTIHGSLCFCSEV